MGLALTYDEIRHHNEQLGRAGSGARFRPFFSFEWLKERLRQKAKQPILKLYSALSEAYELLLNDQADLSGASEKELSALQDLIKVLTRLKSIYAQVDFFDSREFEHLINDTLQLTYSFESEIRLQLRRKSTKTDQEESIKEALALKSQESISGRL